MHSSSATSHSVQHGSSDPVTATSLYSALTAARQYAQALRARQSRDHLYGLLLFLLTFTLFGLIAYLVSRAE